MVDGPKGGLHTLCLDVHCNSLAEGEAGFVSGAETRAAENVMKIDMTTFGVSCGPGRVDVSAASGRKCSLLMGSAILLRGRKQDSQQGTSLNDLK